MENICINNGYWGTKVIGNNKEFMFESRFSKAITKHEADIVVDGEYLKQGGGNNDLDLNKTSSLVQKACILNAIKQSEIRGPIKIMTALPINAFSNDNAYENYKEWVMSMDDNIIDVGVYPEGAAAMLSDFCWYKNKLVCLIDVGGLTINCMIFDNGNMVESTAFSTQLGTIILENRVKQHLQKTELVNIPCYQNKYLLDIDGVAPVLEQYVEDIKAELKEASYPTNIEYRFTGGGALRLRGLFEEHFNAHIDDGAVWENVRGLYLYSKVVWE